MDTPTFISMTSKTPTHYSNFHAWFQRHTHISKEDLKDKPDMDTDLMSSYGFKDTPIFPVRALKRHSHSVL